MVDIYFYVFAKRENSTKRPDGVEPTRYQCEIHSPSSVINPTILLDADSPIGYNYAYIYNFDRYYFVDEWTWQNGLWSASLHVDALASWRDYIGDSTQYILRSSDTFDGLILDNLYPLTNDVRSYTQPLNAGFYTKNIADGYYVVGIINPDSKAVGAISYYVFTPAGFNAFKSALMSNITWADAQSEDISDNLLKTLFNPMQYLVSCKWFPCEPPRGTSISTILFGWWSFPVSGCSRLGSVQFIRRRWDAYLRDAMQHPQATRGRYLNGAPYSRYYLNYAPYGSIELPGTIGITRTLIIEETNDFVTGQTIMHIYTSAQAETEYNLLTITAMLGVDVTLAQSTSNVAGAVSAAGGRLAEAGKNLLTGNVAGAITSAASGIANAASAAAPFIQSVGGTGSFADLNQFNADNINAEYHLIVGEDNADLGRPYCKAAKIDDHPGYLMVAHADVSIPCTANEQMTIKNYMESGFFYE